MRPLASVKAALQAYVDKDRDAIEALLDERYTFTSPIDNEIDRDTYFETCWPGSAAMSAIEVVHGAEDGDFAFVAYEATINGRRFRNSELHHVVNGRILSTEVYFGWNLPHPVPAGNHRDDG